jgi:hypothetical protein
VLTGSSLTAANAAASAIACCLRSLAEQMAQHAAPFVAVRRSIPFTRAAQARWLNASASLQERGDLHWQSLEQVLRVLPNADLRADASGRMLPVSSP